MMPRHSMPALAEEYLAIPVIKGRKTAAERFPGAVDTLCIESMMQDRRRFRPGPPTFWPELRPGVPNQIQSADDKENTVDAHPGAPPPA